MLNSSFALRDPLEKRFLKTLSEDDMKDEADFRIFQQNAGNYNYSM